MEILSIFKKMGYAGISEIADPMILNFLNEVESSIDIDKLDRIILDIYGTAGILLENNKRKILFKYLTEEQAKGLCELFCLKAKNNDFWSPLINLSLSTERKISLLTYFGVSDPLSILEKSVKIDRPSTEIVSPSYGLFPHQELAANKIKKLIQPSRSRVLLHMPTGSGKTRTAMSISCDFIRNNIERRSNGLVVWFADTEELCEQAYDEFKKAWGHLGIGDTNLYRMYSADTDLNLNDLRDGFVVAGLQKLNSVANKQQTEFYELGKRTDLLIFDEAHKAIAPTYQHLVNVFQSTGRASLLGLSATPGRSTFDHQKNTEFADFFNRNKVVLEVEGYDSPVDYLVEKGYLAKPNYHPIPYSAEEVQLTAQEMSKISGGEEIPKSVLERLGIDVKRNIKILSLALELASEDRKIILFACSVKNAESLFTLLRYKGISVGLVTGDTDLSLRRQTIEDYKNGSLKILINFGVLTTGFDAPRTNTAIIARPTNSLTLFSQMVGRATRGEAAGGNKDCDIYVINDALPEFRNMVEAFSHWDDAWDERI